MSLPSILPLTTAVTTTAMKEPFHYYPDLVDVFQLYAA